MKFLVVLLAVAVVGFASDNTFTGHPGGVGHALPGTDDQLDSYAYSDDEVYSSIPASFTDYAVIDDFNPTVDDATIDSYTCWAVTTASLPTALELLVVADASGVPSGAPISQTSYTTAASASGFTFGSYSVTIAVMDIGGASFTTPCWLGSHRNDGSNWYPAFGTTVTGTEAYRTQAAGWSWEPISSSLVAGDLFKVIEGTTSLSRTTWAGIKNMF